MLLFGSGIGVCWCDMMLGLMCRLMWLVVWFMLMIFDVVCRFISMWLFVLIVRLLMSG